MADVSTQFGHKPEQSTDGDIKSQCTWLLSAGEAIEPASDKRLHTTHNTYFKNITLIKCSRVGWTFSEVESAGFFYELTWYIIWIHSTLQEKNRG